MSRPVTVLQGSARSLYSVQVDRSSNIGAFLSSVGKCQTAKVNKELTPSILLNWRNPRRKLINYWLRLTVKIYVSCTHVRMAQTIFGRQRKLRRKFKEMLIVFFYIQGTVMARCVTSGQTVNQQYCNEFLTKVLERVRRKRTELWRNGWILHQDKAPAQNALSVKQFLANKNITVLAHPPYSPDLAPRDFYLFPKIKSVLKGTHFVSVDVKAKTAENLNSLTKHDLRNWFNL